MELSYLKAIGVGIPSGYTIANGAMTADSEHVYFAAAHGSAPKLLIFNMTGKRIETAEFSIHALPSSRSFDAVAIDAENLYLLSNSEALGVLADVFPYSLLESSAITLSKSSMALSYSPLPRDSSALLSISFSSGRCCISTNIRTGSTTQQRNMIKRNRQ